MDRNDQRYHSMENVELVHGGCANDVSMPEHVREKELNRIFDEDHINPDHYKSSTSLECIEAMEMVFGKEAVCNFCTCNAWKYIWRWKHKNGLEDLEKAKWYVRKAEDFFMYSELNMTTEEYETHKHMIKEMRNYIEVNNCPEQDGDK